MFIGIWLTWIVVKNRVGEDNNWVVLLPIALTFLGMFFGFINFLNWVLASLFAILIAVWRVKD